MIKKLLIITGGITAFFILLSVLLQFLLPLDAIKNFAAAKLSEQLKHEVKIKGVSFNIFSGIKLKGVTIANKKWFSFSKEPMVSADSLELRYALWPLFRGKVVIPEISFVKPKILIEKDSAGDYNFSDIFAPQRPARRTKKEVAPKGKKGPDISLFINNFKIKNGKIIFRDYYTGDSGVENADLSISNITLAAVKPADIKFSAVGVYQGRKTPISLSAKAGVSLKDASAKIEDLVLSIAGDSLYASADIGGLDKAPQVSVSASSKKLALDPFLAVFLGGSAPAKKEKTPHGALTKSLGKTFSAVPRNLSVAANFDFKNITLKTLKIDSLNFSVKLNDRKIAVNVKYFSAYKGVLYAKGFLLDLPALSYSLSKLELRDFQAAPFLADMIDSFVPNLIDMKNNVEGALNVSLSLAGRGVEMPEAFDNLKASGVILLSKGRIKRIKSLSSIGEKYNINMLKHDMVVGGLRVNGSIADKILDIAKLSLQDTDLQTAFSGKLDFNKMEYVPGNRLTLKFSPAVTGTLPSEFSVLKDDKGFISADFELQGSLFTPFPSPVFEKAIEAVYGKFKVKIEAKKVEIETKTRQELEKASKTLEAEAKKKLEEEAKKKIKEILKF